MKEVEIVSAVRNEEENLSRFVADVGEAALQAGFTARFFFVEDGSIDRTREVIRGLAESDSSICYSFLEGDVGQSGALRYGLENSSAEIIVMMDADGEHPPNLLTEMLRAIEAGADIAQARRIEESRGAFRSVLSKVFHKFCFRSEENVYFRAITRRSLLKSSLVRRRQYLFRLAAEDLKNFNVRYCRFSGTDRWAGKSQYSLLRLLSFSVYALIANLFRFRPKKVRYKLSELKPQV